MGVKWSRGRQERSAVQDEARGRIYDSVLDTIGATPLVRASRLAAARGIDAEILLKLEFFNPLGSVKDRIGPAMIDELERRHGLDGNSVLVEATSGNTGIGLALVAAVRGLKLIVTLPADKSIERRKMLALMGVEVVLTDPARAMAGAVAKAEEIVAATPGAILVQQFDNPGNPQIHRETTAEEIWRDCGGRLDALVCGVGTGGTITGVGEVLKARNPDIKIFAVEPAGSPTLSGGKPGHHELQGIGASYPSSFLNREIIDEILQAGDDEAYDMAREVARREGLPVGVSSGAAIAVALRIAQRPGWDDRRIVAIVPSFAERYISTRLFPDAV
ncbi:MAG: cysteine synthase A [Rhodovibrionaceae bacterium]